MEILNAYSSAPSYKKVAGACEFLIIDWRYAPQREKFSPEIAKQRLLRVNVGHRFAQRQPALLFPMSR
jgi:hypothetical protein